MGFAIRLAFLLRRRTMRYGTRRTMRYGSITRRLVGQDGRVTMMNESPPAISPAVGVASVVDAAIGGSLDGEGWPLFPFQH